MNPKVCPSGKSCQTRQTYTFSRMGIDLFRPVEQLFRVRRHQRVTLPRQLHDDPRSRDCHAYARAGGNPPRSRTT